LSTSFRCSWRRCWRESMLGSRCFFPAINDHASTRLPSDPFNIHVTHQPSTRCSLLNISIIWVLFGIVTGGNLLLVWDASFVPSHFCPPSLGSVCLLLIVQHPNGIFSLHCTSYRKTLI
jgi:hypothetical protein